MVWGSFPGQKASDPVDIPVDQENLFLCIYLSETLAAPGVLGLRLGSWRQLGLGLRPVRTWQRQRTRGELRLEVQDHP